MTAGGQVRLLRVMLAAIGLGLLPAAETVKAPLRKELDLTGEIDPARTALIVCDMWDRHWCRGATARTARLAPKVARVVEWARSNGVLIIHAPSETMDFYADSPARKRMRDLPRVEPPALLDHVDPPLPIDDSDGGSDTGETAEFKLLSSTTRRQDAVGTVIDEVDPASGIEEVAPLEATLEPRGGAKAGAVVPVRLRARVTEVGTLEVWCVGRDDQEWKLEFDLRGSS